MGPPEAPVDVTDDLYALVVHLQVNCNRDLFDAISAEQLSASQLHLLDWLRGGRRAPTIRQAAKRLRMTEQGASRIILLLANRGLVRREQNDSDYRSKRVYITEKGEETIARLHAARLPQIVAFNELLTVDEREQLHAALHPVIDRHAGAFRPPAQAA